MAAAKDLFRRWLTRRRLVFLGVEAAVATLAFFLHFQIGLVVLALSLLVIPVRAYLDFREAKESEVGYQVVEATQWLQFLDPNAHRARVKRHMRLKALRSGVRYITD